MSKNVHERLGAAVASLEAQTAAIVHDYRAFEELGGALKEMSDGLAYKIRDAVDGIALAYFAEKLERVAKASMDTLRMLTEVGIYIEQSSGVSLPEETSAIKEEK